MERDYYKEKKEKMKNRARVRVGIQMIKSHPVWLLYIVVTVMTEVMVFHILEELVYGIGMPVVIKIIYERIMSVGGGLIILMSIILIIKEIGIKRSNEIESPIMVEMTVPELRVKNEVTHPFLYSYEYDRKTKIQTLRIHTLIDISVWKAVEERIANKMKVRVVEHIEYDLDSKLSTNLVVWKVIDISKIKKGGVLYDEEL